jgi:membrane dipeptidase
MAHAQQPVPEVMLVSERAQALHREALVLDGLTPVYVLDEPYTEGLLAGGIDAGFLSVASEATWDFTLARIEMCLTKVERNPLLRLATCAEDVRLAKRDGKIALMMVTQSAEMIGDQLNRLGILYRLGLRVLGLAYTFANPYGDGCGERRNAGLTFLGHDLLAAVNELPMMLDLSHAGARTSFEAAGLAKAPCVTHANAYTVVANDRNKHDETLRIVAQKAGVIGLCALPRSVKHPEPAVADMMVHLDHLLSLMGEGAVGLGLDHVEGFKDAGFIMPQSRRNRTLRPDIFGSVQDFLDVSYPCGIETIRQAPNLTQAMLDRGYSEARVRAVLGGNWLAAIERHIG